MKGYIFTIIAVSVISGLITSMLSSSKNGLKKYVNFVAGLICTFALLSPIVSIANNFDVFSDSVENIINTLDVSDNVSDTNQIIVDTGTEQICNGVKKAIISKYSFSEDNIDVKVILNDKNIEAIILEKIEIYLKNEATWTDEQQLQHYVEDLVGCHVTIKKY